MSNSHNLTVNLINSKTDNKPKHQGNKPETDSFQNTLDTFYQHASVLRLHTIRVDHCLAISHKCTEMESKIVKAINMEPDKLVGKDIWIEMDADACDIQENIEKCKPDDVDKKNNRLKQRFEQLVAYCEEAVNTALNMKTGPRDKPMNIAHDTHVCISNMKNQANAIIAVCISKIDEVLDEIMQRSIPDIRVGVMQIRQRIIDDAILAYNHKLQSSDMRLAKSKKTVKQKVTQFRKMNPAFDTYVDANRYR